jgi:hypothetical protein
VTPDGRGRLEDRLGRDEPPYRSRGEAQVGRLLDRYGLPFVYEQPTPIFDRWRHRTWHPDYTLPTYAGLIVEYAGMMDIPDYAAGIRHKRSTYARNGLRALFVYPRDLKGPAWPARLAERIRRAGTDDRRPMYRERTYQGNRVQVYRFFCLRGSSYRAMPPRAWPYCPRWSAYRTIAWGHRR